MAPLKLIRYTVEGWGAFPIDMLRYDQAWPCRTDDASKIVASLRGETRDTYVVALLSYRKPTGDRWESFGFGNIKVGEFWA